MGPLHVISVVQPDTDPECPTTTARMAILDRKLAVRGLSSARVVGASFDGTHSEESRAVAGLSDNEARAIGRRFGQVAVFAWCGNHLSVLACASDRRTDTPWRWTERARPAGR
ncbi:MAG: DUF3293 domain-containing protein [Gordonia amarae]